MARQTELRHIKDKLDLNVPFDEFNAKRRKYFESLLSFLREKYWKFQQWEEEQELGDLFLEVVSPSMLLLDLEKVVIARRSKRGRQNENGELEQIFSQFAYEWNKEFELQENDKIITPYLSWAKSQKDFEYICNYSNESKLIEFKFTGFGMGSRSDLGVQRIGDVTINHDIILQKLERYNGVFNVKIKRDII